MYKIQYRSTSNSAWTDFVLDGQLLTFEDKKTATKKVNEYLTIAELIKSGYKYRMVEV